MASYEVELELKLAKYNSKLVFYNKLITKMPLKFLKLYLVRKMAPIVTQRDDCFKELRAIMRRKHPEIFIGGKNGS